MNKSQSAGYIILAIVIVIFTASVFIGGPITETSELSYSNFLEKLSNNEFSKIEKADHAYIKTVYGMGYMWIGGSNK